MFRRRLYERKRATVGGGKRFASAEHAQQLLMSVAVKVYLERKERAAARAAFADALFLMETAAALRAVQRANLATWMLDDQDARAPGDHFASLGELGDYASHSADDYTELFFDDDDDDDEEEEEARPPPSVDAHTFDERLHATLREYSAAATMGASHMLAPTLWLLSSTPPRRRTRLTQRQQTELVRKTLAYLGAYGYRQLLLPNEPDALQLDRMLARVPDVYRATAAALDAVLVAVDATLFRLWLLYRDVGERNERNVFDELLGCIEEVERGGGVDSHGLEQFLRPHLGRRQAVQLLARQLDAYMRGEIDGEALSDEDGVDDGGDDEEALPGEMDDFLASDDADDGSGVVGDEVRRALDELYAERRAHHRQQQGPPTSIEDEFERLRKRQRGGDDDAQRRALFAQQQPRALAALLARSTAAPPALAALELRWKK